MTKICFCEQGRLILSKRQYILYLFSRFLKIDTGVRQGSVLSLQLFAILLVVLRFVSVIILYCVQTIY